MGGGVGGGGGGGGGREQVEFIHKLNKPKKQAKENLQKKQK